MLWDLIYVLNTHPVYITLRPGLDTLSLCTCKYTLRSGSRIHLEREVSNMWHADLPENPVWDFYNGQVTAVANVSTSKLLCFKSRDSTARIQITLSNQKPGNDIKTSRQSKIKCLRWLVEAVSGGIHVPISSPSRYWQSGTTVVCNSDVSRYVTYCY